MNASQKISAPANIFSRILEQLIENGNLIDFGTDFHAFGGWMKKAALYAEAVPGETALAQQERSLIDRWRQIETFHLRLKEKEHHFWKKSLTETLAREIPNGITAENKQAMIFDYVWRLYKGGEGLSEFEEAPPDQHEEVFAKLRDEFLNRLIPPDSIRDRQELQQQLHQELTSLYGLWHNPPKGLNTQEKDTLEKIFFEQGLTLGDLRRTLKTAYWLKSRFHLPQEQFVNVWPVAAQV